MSGVRRRRKNLLGELKIIRPSFIPISESTCKKAQLATSCNFLTSRVKPRCSTIGGSHWYCKGSGLVSTQSRGQQRRRQTCRRTITRQMAQPLKCEYPQRRPALPKDPTKQTTDEFYTTCNLPARWQRPYWFSGYGSQQNPPPHPFYRSSYMDIGWFPPNVHTVPVSFYPSQQRFSNLLATCGMYRNSSLNTALDPQPWGM